MKKLHFQRKKWKHDSRNALCWSFYYVNYNKPSRCKMFSIDEMHFWLCHSNFNN